MTHQLVRVILEEPDDPMIRWKEHRVNEIFDGAQSSYDWWKLVDRDSRYDEPMSVDADSEAGQAQIEDAWRRTVETFEENLDNVRSVAEDEGIDPDDPFGDTEALFNSVRMRDMLTRLGTVDDISNYLRYEGKVINRPEYYQSRVVERDLSGHVVVNVDAHY